MENEIVLKAFTDLLNGIEQAVNEAKKTLQQLIQPQTAQMAADEYLKLFPQEWHERLILTREGDILKVKPKHYLGAQLFAEISQIVKDLDGKYVSAGKNSHFLIPLKTAGAT